MEQLCFAIILAFNVILLIAIRKKFKINNASHMLLLYWISNITIAFIVFNSNIQWNYNGVSFLLVCIDIFLISYSKIYKEKDNTYYRSNKVKCNKNTVGELLLLCFASGIVYTVLELLNNGFTIWNLLSLDGLMETGYYFTDGRYGGNTEIKVSLFEQICLAINYSGFIMAGYAFYLGLITKWMCFIQFFPMVLSMLATTAKTPFISGIFLWICGYLVASNILEKQRSIKYKRVVLFSVIALVLFYFSFYIRYGTSDSEIWYRIFIYAFGHVPCYDVWFSQFDGNLIGYSYGQQTFTMFFGNRMPKELIKVYVTPVLVTEFGWTNVITLFSYVLMDFGYLGSIVFFAIFGIISGLSTLSLKKTRSAIAHSLLGLSYYVIIYSFLVSPFRYLSIVGAFFLFGMYILYLFKIRVGVQK